VNKLNKSMIEWLLHQGGLSNPQKYVNIHLKSTKKPSIWPFVGDFRISNSTKCPEKKYVCTSFLDFI
jgi:hypothetical protein